MSRPFRVIEGGRLHEPVPARAPWQIAGTFLGLLIGSWAVAIGFIWGAAWVWSAML